MDVGFKVTIINPYPILTDESVSLLMARIISGKVNSYIFYIAACISYSISLAKRISLVGLNPMSMAPIHCVPGSSLQLFLKVKASMR